jgi:hypothetical protein
VPFGAPATLRVAAVEDLVPASELRLVGVAQTLGNDALKIGVDHRLVERPPMPFVSAIQSSAPLPIRASVALRSFSGSGRRSIRWLVAGRRRAPCLAASDRSPGRSTARPIPFAGKSPAEIPQRNCFPASQAAWPLTTEAQQPPSDSQNRRRLHPKPMGRRLWAAAMVFTKGKCRSATLVGPFVAYYGAFTVDDAK